MLLDAIKIGAMVVSMKTVNAFMCLVYKHLSTLK